ncbi:MAG TPA: hypothetical protein VNK04_09000 [Gemmataceae bacterium]|nr:hypothetical protein [Gemmataceae bacterium]
MLAASALRSTDRRSFNLVGASPGSSARLTLDLCVRTVRPSLLDLRFSGDPWIVDRGAGPYALCLGNYPLAWIEKLSLDLPSLNRLFHSLRHRRPRRPRPSSVRFENVAQPTPAR